MSESRSTVFVTGATGYMGASLCRLLLERGYAVRALARPGSESRLPAGCEAVIGNALESGYAAQIAPATTLVHLVGVAHPGPSKAEQFRTIDLASLQAAVKAAVTAGVRHLVYVSVAQPAPVMKAYIAVRGECEGIVRASGLNATILRPWYVLGPGHRWPYALLPFYWFADLIPSMREGARRLGLVTHRQMVAALAAAVKEPASGVRIWEVPKIRTEGPGQP